MLRLRWESALLLLGVGSLLAAKAGLIEISGTFCGGKCYESGVKEMKYPDPNLHAQKKQDACSSIGKLFDLYRQLKRLVRMMASLVEQHEPQFGQKGYIVLLSPEKNRKNTWKEWNVENSDHSIKKDQLLFGRPKELCNPNNPF